MAAKFNWPMTFFSLFFLLLFLYLGYWQINRGQEKEIFIDEDILRRKQPGLTISMLPQARMVIDGQPIVLEGDYDLETIFLLDNRVLNGHVGYEVLMPFKDQSGIVVLLNRGFVPMTQSRHILPDIPSVPISDRVDGKLKLNGNIYIQRRPGPEQNFIENNVSPFVVQSAEPHRLEHILALYPHVIRLNAASPGALPRHWPLVTMSPDRHFGYALTWFSMALAITVAYLFFIFRAQE
ncbi:MAG: SURF1 family protein [Pseudomonadales bacterium]|nr:SURF1 family protein [Pseudomonadales bacterium]